MVLSGKICRFSHYFVHGCSIGIFRPVSILNIFSKFYEKIIQNRLEEFLDKHLSIFLSAYRKLYSSQHVLMRLLEEWRHNLDNNYVVGAILIDLSKAFDCIPCSPRPTDR